MCMKQNNKHKQASMQVSKKTWAKGGDPVGKMWGGCDDGSFFSLLPIETLQVCGATPLTVVMPAKEEPHHTPRKGTIRMASVELVIRQDQKLFLISTYYFWK